MQTAPARKHRHLETPLKFGQRASLSTRVEKGLEDWAKVTNYVRVACITICLFVVFFFVLSIVLLFQFVVVSHCHSSMHERVNNPVIIF